MRVVNDLRLNQLLSKPVYDTRSFYLGSHTEIKTHVCLFQKLFDPFIIPHIGASQAPSYELNTTKKADR